MATFQIQPLNIQPHQREHVQRILRILSFFYFYIDGSEMGTGKTYVAAAISILLKMPCIVVCPLAARNTWQTVFTTHGVQTYDLAGSGGYITYDSLRSKRGCQPKHGLLLRDDDGKKVQFYPTTLFSQIVEQGVLLIFDEFQKVKNTSDQYKAAKAMMRQFYTVSGRSRVAFLSGTPLDKEEQAVNFLRMVGFINSRNLYSKVKGELRLEGVEDLHNWGRRVDAKATAEFIQNNLFRSTRAGATNYVFRFFLEVIRTRIMSIMPRPELDAVKDIKNGYYSLTREEDVEYRAAISDLGDSVRWNEYTGEVYQSKNSMGAITSALIRLQKVKVDAMIRKAKSILNERKMNEQGQPITPKVILFADYYDGVINKILDEMADFHPLELTGRLSEDQRTTNVNLFQQPNADHRVLVGNPLVGGLAVNLHDITGLFPRDMFIMANYRINELHQATGRVFRAGVIGTATIRFFYGLSGARENSILSALAKKGKVMKEVVREQSDYGVKFPNEYEDEYDVPTELMGQLAI